MSNLLNKSMTSDKRGEKKILTCCTDCGQKYGKKEKGMMGMWKDTCQICGKKDVPCASAPHDFGIYSNKEIEAEDKVQDLI
jgi:hypothetical protein